MMRVAEKLSIRYGADALITGESLAQVASQTLKAIVCTDAAQKLPVLRPLIGMDKSEITEIARKIDTYEISIQPFEDCCTIFTPAAPQDQADAGGDPRGRSGKPELAALEDVAAENRGKAAYRMNQGGFCARRQGSETR